MENSSSQIPYNKIKSGHRIQELPPNKQSFIHVKIDWEDCTNLTNDLLHRTKIINLIPECL